MGYSIILFFSNMLQYFYDTLLFDDEYANPFLQHSRFNL